MILPVRKFQPLVTQTLLPGAKEVYGQLLLLDFNQLEIQPFYGIRSGLPLTFVKIFIGIRHLFITASGKRTLTGCHAHWSNISSNNPGVHHIPPPDPYISYAAAG